MATQNDDIWEALKSPIPIEQVEFRVQSVSAKGWAILLAYKDARVDQDRLDHVIGPGNWQRIHERIGNDLYCKVGIRVTAIPDPFEPGGMISCSDHWVWKMDVGVPSNTEAIKGEASDSFKRACFNWGIGRELYDYPLILVQLHDNEYRTYQDGNKEKARVTFDFQLKDWTWFSERSDPDDQGKTHITLLRAVDQNGKPRFQYPRTNAPAAEKQREAGTSRQPPHAQGSATQVQNKPVRPQSGGGKPWYNTLDDDIDGFRDRVGDGESAIDILNDLLTRFRVNKKDTEAIKNLQQQR